jgi:hypothetical protein
MKIGYRLDPDDVWRTRYDTRPQGSLRHLVTPEWCACFAASACASCYHAILCPPPSVPFHPSRTETNDHFIVVRASCAPIHRRIISGDTLTGILAFLEWVFLT